MPNLSSLIKSIRDIRLNPASRPGLSIELWWEGANEEGQALPSGIYHLVIQASKERFSLKLVKV